MVNSTTPPEAEPGASVDVPNTGARFRIFEPQVADGEFELAGSSAEDPAVYPFRVQVIDGDTVLTNATVEWQAQVNGEIQQPSATPGQPLRIIEIRGTGTRADYTLSVDGTLQPGSGLTREDSILGRTATGAVRGGTDQYQFTGSITDFGFSRGSADVFVGDSPDTLAQVDPNTFFLNNQLIIVGQGQRANYDVTTSSRLAGRRLTSEDEIVSSTRSGSRARGAVRGGRDEYLFNGSITGFGADAPVQVFVGPADGTVGEQPVGSFALPNTLTITGQGTRANYSFRATGELEGARLTSEDSITGSSATGAVRGGTDSYQFSGRVRNFTASGPVTVRLNGEVVDPATL